MSIFAYLIKEFVTGYSFPKISIHMNWRGYKESLGVALNRLAVVVYICGT
jgi:hypothetical protein